jgi:phospholipase/carboxylesterase
MEEEGVVKSRRWLLLIAAPVAALGVACWLPWQTRLRVLQSGGDGPPNLMLLHGYGSSAEHWRPYTQTIAFPPEGRFLFPEAPETTTRTDGLANGRAWWQLDLASHLRPGKLGVDLTGEDPHRLKNAAKLVRRAMSTAGNSKAHPFVLGGFSQGAMVACEVAFASDEPLAALVVLSGAPVDHAGWREGMAKRTALPVFMSHGRADNILPYDLAERLYADLLAGGLAVTFVPFDGGHEIPGVVVAALGKFLASVKN